MLNRHLREHLENFLQIFMIMTIFVQKWKMAFCISIYQNFKKQRGEKRKECLKLNRHRKGQPGGNSPGLTIHLPLIGLSGQSGAGKSTLAELLSGAFNISRMSFATSIREAAVIAFGDFLNQKYFTEWKDTSLPTHLINNLNNDLCELIYVIMHFVN